MAFFPSSRTYSPADIRQSDFAGESIKASNIIQCLSCQQEYCEVSENHHLPTLCLFDAPQAHERPSCMPLSLSFSLNLFSPPYPVFLIQPFSALDSLAILHSLFPSWLLVPLSRCFRSGSPPRRFILTSCLVLCVCLFPASNQSE